MNNSPSPESSLFQGQICKHLKMRPDSQKRVENLILIIIQSRIWSLLKKKGEKDMEEITSNTFRGMVNDCCFETISFFNIQILPREVQN